MDRRFGVTRAQRSPVRIGCAAIGRDRRGFMRGAGAARCRWDRADEIAQAELGVAGEADVDAGKFADLRGIAAQMDDLRRSWLQGAARFLELDERVHPGIEQHVGARDRRMRERIRSGERRMIAVNGRRLTGAPVFEHDRCLQAVGERGQRVLRLGVERDLAAGDDRDRLARGEQFGGGADVGRIGPAARGEALTLRGGQGCLELRFDQVLRQPEIGRSHRLRNRSLQRAAQIARDAVGLQRDARTFDKLADVVLLKGRGREAVAIGDCGRLEPVEDDERAVGVGRAGQVRDAVRQAHVGVQISDRRAAADARVSVGRRHRDRLVRREDHAHAGIVERCIEHRGFGTAGTGEEQIDLPVPQHVEDRVGAVVYEGCGGDAILQLHLWGPSHRRKALPGIKLATAL